MSRYGVKRVVAHRDVVIIQAKVFMKPEALKGVKDEVMRQLEEDGVVVLSSAFKAIAIRRDKICLLPKEVEDDNV